MSNTPMATMVSPTPSEQRSSTKTVALLDVKFGSPGASIRYVDAGNNCYGAAYDRDAWAEHDVKVIMQIALKTEDIEFIGSAEVRAA